jgi:hypothetical protein
VAISRTAKKPASPKQGKALSVIQSPKNVARRPNELFPAFETYYSPRIAALRERYGLDKVVRGVSDEWDRIRLLRNWIRRHMEINDPNPTPVAPEAVAILDAAAKGGGFHCAHFSIVLHAVLNSYGFVTRRLGCGPGTLERGGHHGVNEVWVNSMAKWVLVDAKCDGHFEKNGVPLSALEIRDEVITGKEACLRRRIGPDGKSKDSAAALADPLGFTHTYRWCSWEVSTNMFTAWPATSSGALIMLDDAFFRSNTWYRDGEPHWAYNTPLLQLTPCREWIEWTPNVIESIVMPQGDRARIELLSFTPNLKSYQMRLGTGAWRNCDNVVTVKPAGRSAVNVSFRAVNLFGLIGPTHSLTIKG